MAFYVGQKVIRYRDTNTTHLCKDPPLNEPVTVLWVGEWRGATIIDLVEYPTEERDGFVRGYWAAVFRPIVAKPTSISIFTAMLGPKQRETIDG